MIVFDKITKKFASGHTALEDVSFSINSGEFVFLMGPSGSGKTTLLRLMLREFEPSEGQIMVADQELSKLPGRKVPMLRRQIGAAFQDFKLIPDKSAFENVALILEIIGKPKNEINKITHELLEKVGLEDKMYLYPSQLSGGEVQRVAIARAIATDPVLLFADEPTGNLDPETSREIIKLLEEINQSGTTIMMATHDMILASEYPHRKIVLTRGKLTQDSGATAADDEKVSDETEADEKDSADEKKTKPKKAKKREDK